MLDKIITYIVCWYKTFIRSQHTMYVMGMYQPSINYTATFQNGILLTGFTIGTGNFANYAPTSMQFIIVLQVPTILQKLIKSFCF